MTTLMRLSALLVALGSPALADGEILVQSTTSTRNSGLYDHLLPLFTAKTRIEVRVVAVGTGQALKNARNCDADVLLVHAKAEEEQFVEEGFGTARHDLMYNDFVIVGPEDDPARISGMTEPVAALKQIARQKALFASRGDNSGTHSKELTLWETAKINPDDSSGDWYRSTGSGMGATLNTGIGLGAYVLVDRASWITFGNKQDYEIMVEGHDALFNQYGVILIDPDRCPESRAAEGQIFIDWLLGSEGQEAIGAYEIGGEPLFFPNGGR
ncbi:MAG: substrate-binding domain-containing protein [Pseudomonadota bacterium]